MKKITWINFLHIYQPPWQERGIIEQAANESYEYLFRLFEKHKKFRATINISGSLVDQLAEFRPELLKKLQNLVKKNKLELTGSAKYHALLPLLSVSEIKRQIILNQETLNKYFPDAEIKGFYLPEMAFAPFLGKVIKNFGYQYLIVDPIICSDKINNKFSYFLKDSGLQIIFRNREISKAYPAEIIFEKLKVAEDERELIITGTDGEMYGHRHEDWQGHLEQILQNKNLEVLQIRDYLSLSEDKKIISLSSGSWESTKNELKKGIPFALWNDPKNAIHQFLWDLVNLSTELLTKYKKDPNFYWARQHLDRGLASCTFWWASAKKPSDFSPLTWNPDMIDNGSEELVRSIRSLNRASVQERIKAERLYIEIKKNTWEKHWKKYHKQ
ncbi:hypothetical protein H6761_03825 [Candidatus Nomurabacteria bacterium]|nr:hypothetical protein [Candidatus Nomurabacteria bacterium]